MIEAPETAVDQPGEPAESSPARHGSIRWLAGAAILGGALWITWAALDAISSGESDLGNLAISIRLFLILPSIALIAAGSIGLAWRQGDAPRAWLLTALVGAAMLLAGTAFDLWQIRFLGLVGLLVGSFALAVRAFRVRALPRWTALLLAAGCVLMILGNTEGSGPWLWTVFGAGWIAAGYALWSAAPTFPRVPSVLETRVDFMPELDEALHGASIRPVLALARVEGRRLLTHPAFLLSPVLGLGVVGGAGPQRLDGLAVLALSGFGFFTVGWGTLLAANLGALRSRRHHTEELYATTPLPARSRTAAHVAGLAWPIAAGLVVTLAASAYLQVKGHVPLESDFGTQNAVPFSLVMFQGPALIALFGALGVFLARWLPSVTAAPPAIVATFMLEIPFIWADHTAVRWLAPLALSSDKLREAEHLMGLHILYLFGLAVLLGSIAAMRNGRSRATMAFAAGGAAAALAGGVLQVLAG